MTSLRANPVRAKQLAVMGDCKLSGPAEKGLKNLGAVVLSLLHGLSLRSPISFEVSLTYEQHAMAEICGHVLPCRCCLGCSVLVGASEAGLGMLICSRCQGQDTTACECQKLAWRLGGYCTVCAEQGAK